MPEIHPDERAQTCAGFLRPAADWFADHGISRIERVMTDKAWPTAQPGLAHGTGRAGRAVPVIRLFRL